MLQSWDERRVSEKKPRLSWLPLGTKTLQANSRHDDWRRPRNWALSPLRKSYPRRHNHSGPNLQAGGQHWRLVPWGHRSGRRLHGVGWLVCYWRGSLRWILSDAGDRRHSIFCRTACGDGRTRVDSGKWTRERQKSSRSGAQNQSPLPPPGTLLTDQQWAQITGYADPPTSARREVDEALERYRSAYRPGPKSAAMQFIFGRRVWSRKRQKAVL